MKRRGERSTPTAADLHRAPIVTAHLIVREASRADAGAIEAVMTAAGLGEGRRTSDGARRFSGGHAEVPVWSATRVVCELGSMRVLGGLVMTDDDGVHRIGWWLDPDDAHHAIELVIAAVDRVRSLGAQRIVSHIRVGDDDAAVVAEAAGFRAGDPVRHVTAEGEPIDFVEYSIV